MYRRLALGVTLLLVGCSARADRPATEEIVVPALIANGCWGGIVRFDEQERKFTVDNTVCNDALIYHLEFSHDLRLTSKRKRDAD
jgi:hypothetical protein